MIAQPHQLADKDADREAVGRWRDSTPTSTSKKPWIAPTYLEDAQREEWDEPQLAGIAGSGTTYLAPSSIRLPARSNPPVRATRRERALTIAQKTIGTSSIALAEGSPRDDGRITDEDRQAVRVARDRGRSRADHARAAERA